jgi:hypothetical protein
MQKRRFRLCVAVQLMADPVVMFIAQYLDHPNPAPQPLDFRSFLC